MIENNIKGNFRYNINQQPVLYSASVNESTTSTINDQAVIVSKSNKYF